MLELHIWGPSFTLPSISPQSLSAIAYLNLTQDPTTWTLIPSSNPLLSPSRELPALRDGTVWVPGFHGIIEYLRHKNGSALDDALVREERADALAFGTYIESEGGRLLDLSMYLADENFDVLRGVFAKLLPVPARYYIPGVLRREARGRCDGLIPASSSSSSVSATDIATRLPLPSAMTATALPATKEKILTKAAAERIKLVAIATDFLGAIQSRLGGGRYFFGDEPSSLDCLAVGYLSLGLYAELPNGWLRDEMLARHGRLCKYVNDVRGRMLGHGVDVVAVMSGQATMTTSSGRVAGGGLPWGIVEPQYVPWVTGFFLNGVMEMVGITSMEGCRSGRDEEEQPLEKEEGMKSLQRWETTKKMAVVVGCIGAFIGHCVWSGLITMELSGRGKNEVAGGVAGSSRGREDDDEKDAANEMRLLEGFGSAEAILGLGKREPHP